MKGSLRVMRIERGTTVDGPGFRTSIYLAGCTHHCPGCHNPSTWDFNAGQLMSIEELLRIIDEEDFDVTLSGGDPFCSASAVLPLAKAVREQGRGLWIYTGYTWEEIMADATMLELARQADVVIDGPFILAEHDPDLLFRGSANQRLIDVRKSIDN